MLKSLISPGSLAEYLNARRDGIFLSLSERIERSTFRNFFVTFLLLGICALFSFIFSKTFTRDWVPIVTPQFYLSASIVVCAASFFAILWRFFARAGKSLFMFFAFALALAGFHLVGPFTEGKLSLDTSAFNILTTYLILFLALYIVRGKSFNFQFLSLFGASVFTVLLYAYLSKDLLRLDGKWINQSNRIIFIFSVFVAERLSRTQASGNFWDRLVFFFNPAYLFTPLPLKSSQLNDEDDVFSLVKGCYDIVLCTLAMAAAQAIDHKYIADQVVYMDLSLIETGYYKYLIYYFRSLAWIGFPIAICRLFGMRMNDYFDKPLLATNPLDRWRKWNTYYYQWFYSFIFFPLLKRKHSVFFAVMVVFFVTLVLHLGMSNYNLFFPSVNSLSDVQ
ncbi:MAG: hypothetical protein EOP04_11605, partial [Proteobacteria bacterium]